MPAVLMLCKAFPPGTGGVETYSEQVARGYRRRGMQVLVITQTRGRPGWQHRRYPEGEIRVFNTGPGGQMVTAVKMLLQVTLSCRRRRFEIHHATTWRPALALLAAKRRAPIVISVHGREIPSAPRALRPLMRRVFERADLVVAVSSATASRCRAALGRDAGAHRWIVVGNGLTYPTESAAARNQALTGEPLRVLTLARLIERKNIPGCIEALKALHEGGVTNFEYRIAGDGPLAGALQEQIRAARLADNVEMLGYVPDTQIPDLYRWADVFLHPQIDVDDGDDFEGFGISISDAMSFGCLAIAGSGSGPSDFVISGVTGVLVDGRDQDQLQDAIGSVLTNPGRYRGMARKGRDYVHAELSWDKHIHAILCALRS